MDSGAGRNRSKAWPLRRLSLAKKDGQRGSSKEKNKKQIGVSITSFFKNTPPAKLACPLCAKLVPRFKINEHIDSRCQDFAGENDSEASADDHNQQEKACAPLPKTSPRVLDEEKDSNVDGVNQDSKTSPYFKKNCLEKQGSPKTNEQAKMVKTVSLGSLSSKLSKRVLRFSETANVDSIEASDDSEPSSSQKENWNENMSVQAEPLVMSSAEASVNLPQVEKPVKCATVIPAVESLESEAVQPVKSAASFRLVKRKKEESPDACATPVLGKKSRNAASGENNPFPIFSRSQTSPVSVSQSAGSTTQSVKVEGSESEHGSGAKNQIVAPGRSQAPPHKANNSPVEQFSLKQPYYLKNFLTVLGAVLENEDDRMLFNEEDLSSIHRFKQLSVPGQMLYVRLFQRKLRWLQLSKLDYAEISSDLKPVAQELVCSGFLQSESDLEDIQDALELLPAPELRNLAKTFHLGGPGSSAQKQRLVEGLLRLARQRSLFALAPGQSNTAAAILKRAKQLAGSCVRLRRGPRAVFSRVLLLFSLTDTLEEEEMAAGQGQLYTILLVSSGRLAFPAYTVQRCAKIFQDRDNLIRYETAVRRLQEVVTAMQAGHWEDALGLYTSAKATWQDLKLTYGSRSERCQEELPVFLRCFTVGWTYTRILSRGVEILQRLRRYEDAVEELRSLLSQSVFCPDSRGRWWDRLALDLHQHLKRPEQAISAIRDGLMDPLVRTGHRLSLHQRAVRMSELASFKKYRLQLRNLPAVHVQDVPHVTIRGQLFPHEGGTGKSVFLRPAAADEGSGEGRDTVVMCSVEELALAHYRELGFDQGIHGEGSTFSTLFGLLMWDIIFTEGVPDVFRTPYQTCPLDLHTDSFYENRREAIETWVELLRQASTETLRTLLADVWHSQQGRPCALVNWERFSSLQEAQSLVACLGGHFLSGVFLRMAKDYRHSRGGLPDLVVWNTSNSSYKLVEVKGPNDRLSQKQQLWLDELHKLGSSVEVCHVSATGARGARLE
uniref:Fanconi-associated nuclease n=1 Tax=Electrophorus electricus TaxID=8005 RepID=A0A4W4HFC2_ELEEL